MPDEVRKSENWQGCPPGLLRGMVDARRTAQRRRQLQAALSVTAVLVAAGLLGNWALGYLRAPSGNQFGNIACSEVQQRMPDYRAGRLDDELAARVRIHLENCPICGPRFRQAAGSVGQTARLDAWNHHGCCASKRTRSPHKAVAGSSALRRHSAEQGRLKAELQTQARPDDHHTHGSPPLLAANVPRQAGG
ncbi:MAG: zf-HC2 domain-containing protein [Planctomycetota bacterium]|nr:zf-HC2 domain-containing protein [Planctomycetota bacterium]